MRTGYENKLLAILSLSFGFVFFDRLALSFLFPFVSTELKLTNAHLGMLSSALSRLGELMRDCRRQASRGGSAHGRPAARRSFASES